ncbi:MAG: YebC/PmpR family DNA-binding transcriptional regulator [Bacilli bacterium]
MAGHSKWKNIAHRKGKQDSSKGQLFTKLCKDIHAAARRGGGNPDTNYHLKVALEKARAASVPNDTITRTVAKATGALEGMQIEELVYEGYGPAGVAILLELSTSNRNRTAAEIRHLFSKAGGSLGESGCVAWMFKRVGLIDLGDSALFTTEEATLLALEAGADDLEEQESGFLLYTAPEDLTRVDQSLQEAGVYSDQVQIAYLPVTTVAVPDQDVERVAALLGELEEHDDVQNVYTNAEFAEAQ